MCVLLAVCVFLLLRGALVRRRRGHATASFVVSFCCIYVLLLPLRGMRYHLCVRGRAFEFESVWKLLFITLTIDYA